MRTYWGYTLHAFVVMPNHVHALVSPNIPLPRIEQNPVRAGLVRQARQYRWWSAG